MSLILEPENLEPETTSQHPKPMFTTNGIPKSQTKQPVTHTGRPKQHTESLKTQFGRPSNHTRCTQNDESSTSQGHPNTTGDQNTRQSHTSPRQQGKVTNKQRHHAPAQRRRGCRGNGKGRLGVDWAHNLKEDGGGRKREEG